MFSNDEEDYMSDKFLGHCAGNDDIRPGLAHSHSTKRKYEIEKKKRDNEIHRKKIKPLKALQEERLKEGLGTALDESNKGFALLQKMGFKPGTSLGKGGGILEPINVEVKVNRMGLGWQHLIQEKKRKLEEIRKLKMQIKESNFDPIKYRERMSNEHNQKKIMGDLAKSQKVCYDIDTREGFTEAQEYWFWPVYTWECDDEDEPDKCDEDEPDKCDDEDEPDKCDDEDEPDKCERKKDPEREPVKEDLSIPKIRPEELYEIFEPVEQLQIITSYLRTTYSYCIWCGIEFECNLDMERTCPGASRADHE